LLLFGARGGGKAPKNETASPCSSKNCRRTFGSKPHFK